MIYNYVPLLFLSQDYGTAIRNLLPIHDNIPLSFDSLAQSMASINPVGVGVESILLFTSLVWISSYQLGLFLNLKYTKIGWKKRLILHLQTLLLCPVIGLVETFPAFWATLEYCLKKKNAAEKMPIYDFYIINK